ncbi:hypothetical protein FRC08_009408 [Ceratobasidium sp. 394]|nr:hypothetical protein FRC08_009408 [Ceratobasidium sp. 394]KAG9100148.1 hypothetical protein FS749_016100 [Ceratobasidium sp. UAMH 11750]
MAQTALQPVNPATVVEAEKENEAPWVVRKLVGSMTGRMVMSSYETLKATSTSVICLSPWGDSSPLLLPCIRFRDLVVHTVIAATGGTAAIAAPVMGPIADTAISSLGDTIAVEIGTVVAYDLGTKLANDLIADKAVKAIIPVHSARLETTSVKTILITLKYKHTMSDAALGFFRSGTVHADGDLFSDVKDYLSVEKGWFSPYLFASSRRPIIPRSMKPDVVFCHGPFLAGDYRIAETLLAESASIIKLCEDPPPLAPLLAPADVLEPAKDGAPTAAPHSTPPKSPMLKATEMASGLGHKLSSYFHRPTSPAPSADTKPGSKPPSAQPSPALSASSLPVVAPVPRRILVLVLGLSPHRKLWTTSARPGESVLNYHLLNGCPALVLPATSAQGNTPLVAWDTLTLEHMHTVGRDQGGVDGEAFKGIVTCLFEYLSLCVDWERVIVPDEVKDTEVAVGDDFKKKIVRDGLELVLAGAVRSHDSKAVKADVDANRAGVAMFRMP